MRSAEIIPIIFPQVNVIHLLIVVNCSEFYSWCAKHLCSLNTAKHDFIVLMCWEYNLPLNNNFQWVKKKT